MVFGRIKGLLRVIKSFWEKRTVRRAASGVCELIEKRISIILQELVKLSGDLFRPSPTSAPSRNLHYLSPKKFNHGDGYIRTYLPRPILADAAGSGFWLHRRDGSEQL